MAAMAAEASMAAATVMAVIEPMRPAISFDEVLLSEDRRSPRGR